MLGTAERPHAGVDSLTRMPTSTSSSGAPLAYGWDENGAVVAAQAEQLRRSAALIAAGASTFSGEARRLTEAGEGTWYPASVSRALLHPRIVGDRPAVRGRQPAAILDRSTYAKLAAAADLRQREATGRPTGSIAGLLAELAECGRCGAKLRLGGPRDARAYRCPRGRRLGEGRVSCGRTQINERGLDAYVTERALTSWAAGGAAHYRAVGPPQVRALDAEVRDMLAAAAHLEAQYGAGLLRGEEYQMLRERSATRISDLQRRRDAAAAAGLPAVDGAAVRDWWVSATLPERHALVGAVFPVVRVLPAMRPGRGRDGETIDPDRVTLAGSPGRG
jgi:hypothetical protein